VPFNVGLVHDLAADGAQTVTFVGLRPKEFWVLSLNVSCFVSGYHVFSTVLTCPIHFVGVW
jgi:hypothetical protein